MTPEFYAIIGVGASLGALIVALAGLTLYLNNQADRRIDRLEMRFDRFEERILESIELLREQVHSLDKRVAKLEWMFEVEFRTRPGPPDSEAT